MPSSMNENKPYALDIITRVIKPRHILDVGCGMGTYYDLLKPHLPDVAIDGVEIWEPYISQYKLDEKYDYLYFDDARQIGFMPYDLVIFGDVLEHMTNEDALSVWDIARRSAGWGMISLPIVHYPQGAEFGNPYEEHVQDHINVDDLERDFGPFDYKETFRMTGTFFKRFE